MKNLIAVVLFLIFMKAGAQLAVQNQQPSIGFVKNKGQFYNQNNKANTDVFYLLNAPGMNVQLRKTGFSYDFYETERHIKKVNHVSFLPTEDTVSYTYTTKLHRVDFDFENANPAMILTEHEKSSAYNNYYNMPWKSNGVEMVYNYKKVIYKNLYKGIDLVFSVPDDAAKPVEYNFVVHSNGNINDIKFRVRGAKNTLEGDRIKFNVRFGAFEETIPLSWTESDTGNEALKINYRQICKNVYGFKSENNLKGKKVIIDPVPIRMWGTYFGGYATAFPAYVETDALNNVYVSGSTASTQFVATAGAFQSTYVEGSSSGYVSKLSPDGAQIWGTYYCVVGKSITIDSDLNVIFCGKTSNSYPNLASPGAYQTSKNTYADCYVVKLNPSGLRLWGTYYGGNGNEEAGSVSIVTDSTDNIYFVGSTNSTQYMATAGTFQPRFNGGTDGFIVKFSPFGDRLWGTYFGGSEADGLNTVNISDDDFLYVAGTANSGGLGTPGSYKSDWDGTNEIYIGKFDTSGARLWSTYAGGSGYDYMLRAALHGTHLYLQGRTSSTSNIATPGSYFPYYIVPDNRVDSEFVMSFDTQNQSMAWGTYFNSMITGLAVNQNGEALFCGDASGNSNIATPDAYMPVKGMYSKSFLVKLGSAGERIWGTYYGGDKAEQNCYVAVDTAGDIYMHGITNGSMSGIATPGAHQSGISPVNVGATYIVKFRDCNSFSTLSSNSPVCVGRNINLTAQGGSNYLWTGPDGFTSTQQNPVIPSASALKAGTYSCAISGTAGCDATQTVEIIVGDTAQPVPTLPNLPQLTSDCSITVSQIPTATDGCDGILNAVTIDPLSYTIAGNYIINWNFTDSSGNSVTQPQSIVVTPPNLTIESNVMLYSCAGNPFDLTAAQTLITTQAGVIFAYYDDAAKAQQQIDPITSPTSYTVAGSGQIFVVVTLPNGCKVLSNISLNYNPFPVIPTYVLEKCFGTGGQVYDLSEALLFIDPRNELEVTFYATAADMLNNIPIPDAVHFTTTTATYRLYVKAKNTWGCTATGTIELKAGYATETTLPAYKECEGTDAVTFDLSQQQAAIIATLPAGNYDAGYYNVYADAINGTSNTISPVLNLTLTATTIYYRFKAMGSCPYIFKQELSLIQNSDFVLEPEYGFCAGDSVTITLPDGFYMYKWSNGTIGQTAVFTVPGTYSATVSTLTDGVICESIRYFIINQYNGPNISEVVTADLTAQNNTITVLPYNEDYLYSLDDISYRQENVFTGLEAGLYTVFVKDKGECGKISKMIALLDYPKYFTPNADGKFDYWHVKFAGFNKALITIYDRYGKLITTLKQNDRGWDGTYNGYALPATDYWFILQQEGKPDFKGHFSLIR